jgi:hypothetical protein
MGEEEQKELELPLQSNSRRHPTPLFWYLGFHGSFWRVDKIQNGGCCHGNQGAKIVKFIPNFKKLYSNVTCHMQICKQRY